jgi:hypothetical protein
MAVSGSLTTAAASAAAYQVVGVGSGTLHVHNGPSLAASVIGNLPNGTSINVVCQTTGDPVNGSAIWDQIDSPTTGYVADWYTSTPNVGTWSPGIPQCGSTPTTPPDVTVALSMNGQVRVPATIAQAWHVGPYWSGYCEAFVGYATKGPAGRGYGSAMADYYDHARRGLIHQGVPPSGAVVYWDPGGSSAGHIGISWGNGQEISTYGYVGWTSPIQIHPYTYFADYLGWAYP